MMELATDTLLAAGVPAGSIISNASTTRQEGDALIGSAGSNRSLFLSLSSRRWSHSACASFLLRGQSDEEVDDARTQLCVFGVMRCQEFVQEGGTLFGGFSS